MQRSAKQCKAMPFFRVHVTTQKVWMMSLRVRHHPCVSCVCGMWLLRVLRVWRVGSACLACAACGFCICGVWVLRLVWLVGSWVLGVRRRVSRHGVSTCLACSVCSVILCPSLLHASRLFTMGCCKAHNRQDDSETEDLAYPGPPSVSEKILHLGLLFHAHLYTTTKAIALLRRAHPTANHSRLRRLL